MDPDANVSEQWDIVNARDYARADRLRELQTAYAEWVGNGGFRAEQGQPNPRTVRAFLRYAGELEARERGAMQFTFEQSDYKGAIGVNRATRYLKSERAVMSATDLADVLSRMQVNQTKTVNRLDTYPVRVTRIK